MLARLSPSFLSMVFIVLASLGKPAGIDHARATEISSSRAIKIITPSWQGQTNEDGTGIFFDILRAVYARENIRVESGFAPMGQCREMVLSGKADAMVRKGGGHFQGPGQITPRFHLFADHAAVVYKKDSIPSWQGIHSLDYKRMVWLKGYDYHLSPGFAGVQFADRYGAKSREEAWFELNMDRFDAFVDNLSDLDYYIEHQGVNISLYGKQILWLEKTYLSFRDSPGSIELIRIYDAGIKILFGSGQLEKIYHRWGKTFYPGHWAN